MIKSVKTSVEARRTWLPIVVFAMGLLLTAAATYFVFQNLKLRSQQEFHSDVLEAEGIIKGRIDSYIALLRGGSGLYAVNRWVDANEFALFVERLRINEFYPGTQGFGIAMRVNASNREEITAKIREDFPDFQIRPDQGEKEAFPIILLEPMDERNRVAIGYDMFSEPVRRAAMARSRDSGLPAATGKVTLVQEIEGPRQPGFLIYVPIYSSGQVPASLQERQQAIEGFVYAPFRAHDFLRVMAQMEWGVDFEVYDGTEVLPENLLFDSTEVNGPLTGNGAMMQEVSTIEIAGQPWTVRFSAPRHSWATARWIVLLPLSGLVISLVLFFLTSAQNRARQQAEAAHSKLQQSQAALQASEELHRTVTQTASDGIIVADAAGTIQSANAAAERILGYGPNELTGRKMIEIIPERLREPHRKGLSQFIETRRRRVDWAALQMPGLRKDGTEIPMEISYGSFTRNGEQFFTGILRDISERKAAEEALRASQLQLQTIADALPVLIGAVDGELRYRFNNRTYERWFGISSGELRGRRMEEVLGPEAFTKVKTYLEQGLSGRDITFEVEMPDTKGGSRYVHGTVIPEFSASHKVEGLFLLMMDISDRKRQENRAQFLAQAGKALSESLDYQTTLRNVARSAVPIVADWCIVDMLTESGELKRLEAVHPGKQQNSNFDRIDQQFRLCLDNPLVKEIASEGTVLFEAEVTDDLLVRIAANDEHLQSLRESRIRSLISVPIRGRARIYGIMTFLTVESARIYTKNDVRALEELALRLGLALENFLFYEEAQKEIEERRVVEQALRESEERFRIMVEQARDYAIFMLDAAGNISSWNSGAERILGYTEEEILGQNGRVLFTPEDQANEVPEQEMETSRTTGKSLDERWHMRKDGSRFFCSGYMFALRNDLGELRGFTKIMRDVTERKRWEEGIQRLNEELEFRVEQRTAALRESYEQMETFTYTVAHDLRAPLRSMLGFSQAVLEENEEKLDETSQDFLHRIVRAARRMDSLIQDLLAYSHITRTDLKFEPVSLQNIVSDVLNVVADEAENKNVNVVPGGDFPDVLAHRATLHTIVMNLVNNAIKFSALKPGARVEIHAEPRQRDGERFVRLWVIDNGIGISPEHHERIFRVFERLHGPDSYSGTGIGLAIVKKGVGRMNGFVGVESKPNEGSRFWIELPAV